MTQPNSTPPLDKTLQGITLVASPTPADKLHPELRMRIASRHQRLAGAVNAELTCLYWGVGQRLRTEVLGGADCAKYGTQMLDMLGHQLTQEFGRGFESRNLRRMVKFAESFPDAAIVSTLSAKLSWGHMVAIVALKTPQACQFYASQASTNKSEFGGMLTSSPSEAFCCNRRTAYQARKQNIGSCSLTAMQHQQLTINRDAKKC